jgi:hypothetical protein
MKHMHEYVNNMDQNAIDLGKKHMCKVAREVVGGPRGPIVIIVKAIQCKVD